MLRLLIILVQLAADAVRWCGLLLRSQRSIAADLWRWVLVYPIRRSANSIIPVQMRIIAALTRMASVPVRFLVDYITNTSSRPTVHN